MIFFPVFLNMDKRKALIIGAGKAGLSKANALAEFGIPFCVISKKILNPEAWSNFDCEIVIRAFETACLDSYNLIFACTDDVSLNRSISEAVQGTDKLVLQAGDSLNGDFITGAVHKTKELSFAVSSAGRNISLAVKSRNKIREVFKADGQSAGMG